MTHRIRPSTAFVVLVILGTSPVLSAETNSLVPRTLSVIPAKFELRGRDAIQQLGVDALMTDQAVRDWTAKVQFETSDPKVATVDDAGLVTPRGDGSATITVRVGSVESKVPLSVKDYDAAPPVNFANQVVPIFTKLGCNSGGCHGKSGGQNGFRLGLLGFEPKLDYETLVMEGRGRRIFPAAPDQSLLLLKATAKLPHGGGKRLDPGSHEYQVVRRWISTGMPVGKATDPVVDRIEIYPSQRVMTRGSRQQVVVTAHYSDGSTEDVTRWTHYQSNDADVASVEEAGGVETHEIAGQAAIMARYQSQVAVFRATVPLGVPIAKYPEFPTDNVVDAAAVEQWKALGLVPSDLCGDAEFIRRASLDVTGTLPTLDELKTFVDDRDPSKRAKLVDRLLDRPEYATFFAVKWADLLRNQRDGRPLANYATYGFHDWIRENLAKNVPYDQFVRSVIAASGSPETSPPVLWSRKLRTPDAFVDDTAQVFLGMRLQCAKCHHHPMEKWSQNDYYGFAAFFARVGRKVTIRAQENGRTEETIYPARSGSVTHPTTGERMAPKSLGGQVIKVSANEDPRQKLVDWMGRPDNPFFAQALVNRYWSHFFGRGVVEPIDDMRETNPPSNPKLLEGLADSFRKSGYDLKGLIRTICTSRVYGLSSIPNEFNAKDKQSFARHYPKRMSAEVLLDAISGLSGVSTSFAGLPAGTRAIELPDQEIASAFLDAFGRPKRNTSCECERVGDASLSQSLMLLNSADVQAKLAAAGSRAEQLAKDPRPDAQKLDELFRMAFARPPGSGESTTALDHLTKNAANKKTAYEDVIWALINAKEFQFID